MTDANPPQSNRPITEIDTLIAELRFDANGVLFQDLALPEWLAVERGLV